ncbi:MAG: hypothetical protein PWP24_653 [Clostridiales bacterium]|nr:hypothetical protein [Clostridiales bacterium]
MHKKITWKKTIILLGILFVVLCAAFDIYVGDYYHANGYVLATKQEDSESIVADYENYTIYGNTITDNGFIFYPGGKVDEKAYEPLMYSLSEKGICCVLVKMPFKLAVFDVNAANEIMEDLSTVNNWYIGGHSLGGAMAASFAAKHPDELKGLILLAAYPISKLPDDFRVLSIYGSKDGVLNMEKYQEEKENAVNMEEIVISGGNHAYFGNYGEQKGDGTAAISPSEQWEITTDAIVDWIP